MSVQRFTVAIAGKTLHGILFDSEAAPEAFLGERGTPIVERTGSAPAAGGTDQ
jgi:hypothetical protein